MKIKKIIIILGCKTFSVVGCKCVKICCCKSCEGYGEEVTEWCTELRHEEVHDLHSSPRAIREVTYKKVGRDIHRACIGRIVFTGKVMRRNHSENPGIDTRIILKRIQLKRYRRVYAWLFWLSISVGLLWTRPWTVGWSKMRGIAWLAEKLWVSQEGICCRWLSDNISFSPPAFRLPCTLIKASRVSDCTAAIGSGIFQAETL